MPDKLAPAVFMVVPGHFVDGQPQYPTFVQSQMASLIESGVTVHLGLFTGRTNPLEVIRGVRRLKEAFRRSGAKLIHAQYGTITALAASYIAGSVPLIISLGGSDILGIPIPRYVLAASRSVGKTLYSPGRRPCDGYHSKESKPV